MPLLANLFGNGRTDSSSGAHSIDPAGALAQTTPGAISPTSPPDWNSSNVRTAPIVTRWRPMTWSEAEALESRAVLRETQSRNWHRAMAAMERIEKADAKDQGRLRKYQGVAANAEFKKLSANAKLAEKLHQLRPGYANLGNQIETAEIQASRAVTESRRKYQALIY